MILWFYVDNFKCDAKAKQREKISRLCVRVRSVNSVSLAFLADTWYVCHNSEQLGLKPELHLPCMLCSVCSTSDACTNCGVCAYKVEGTVQWIFCAETCFRFSCLSAPHMCNFHVSLHLFCQASHVARHLLEALRCVRCAPSSFAHTFTFNWLLTMGCAVPASQFGESFLG